MHPHLVEEWGLAQVPPTEIVIARFLHSPSQEGTSKSARLWDQHRAARDVPG